MATVTRSEAPDEGEVSDARDVSGGAGYNGAIDAMRAEEYPMLRGKFEEVTLVPEGKMEGTHDPRQGQPTSTTPARRSTPNPSWTPSPTT